MVAIYAMGGGWGHLTRAVALARILDGPVIVFSNTAYADLVRSAEPGVTIEAGPPHHVLRRVSQIAPGTLVVDTFPRGVGGELTCLLPRLKARKVFVRRDLNPRYLAWANLEEWIRQHYDLVFIPGELEANMPGAVVTPPWLIRDPAELPRRQRFDVLVCAAGNTQELEWYGQVARMLASRNINAACVAPTCPPGCPPELWVRHWPAIDLISCARVVIGGGGYNTVYECQACGVPLLAKPWPRKYDRQERRARHSAAATVSTPEEAVAAACSLLHTPTQTRPGPGGPPWQAARLLR